MTLGWIFLPETPYDVQMRTDHSGRVWSVDQASTRDSACLGLVLTTRPCPSASPGVWVTINARRHLSATSTSSSVELAPSASNCALPAASVERPTQTRRSASSFIDFVGGLNAATRPARDSSDEEPDRTLYRRPRASGRPTEPCSSAWPSYSGLGLSRPCPDHPTMPVGMPWRGCKTGWGALWSSREVTKPSLSRRTLELSITRRILQLQCSQEHGSSSI
jgi:hypothetical protein